MARDRVTFLTFYDVLIDFHVQYFQRFAIRASPESRDIECLPLEAMFPSTGSQLPIGAVWTSGDLHSFLLVNGLQILGTFLGLLPVNMDILDFFFFFFFFCHPVCLCVWTQHDECGSCTSPLVDLLDFFFFFFSFFLFKSYSPAPRRSRPIEVRGKIPNPVRL